MKSTESRIKEAEAESLWSNFAGITAILCILFALFG
jgi:hypothetical protein